MTHKFYNAMMPEGGGKQEPVLRWVKASERPFPKDQAFFVRRTDNQAMSVVELDGVKLLDGYENLWGYATDPDIEWLLEETPIPSPEVSDSQKIDDVVAAIRRHTEELLAQGPEACRQFLIKAGIIEPEPSHSDSNGGEKEEELQHYKALYEQGCAIVEELEKECQYYRKGLENMHTELLKMRESKAANIVARFLLKYPNTTK